VLPIDRHNRNKVMQVYAQAIARVDNGESFALAPEGTRQPTPELGKFKRGPFEFAINARAQIVPVVLMGAYEVMPRSSILLNVGKWKRKVVMQITPPVATEGYTLESSLELQEKVRAQMVPVFAELKREQASATKQS
jgi:1-acyl-sn-glycerol-3-phosphate acyltransferase